ncbi:uncharacterized protein LOC143039244 [Oratosquilla oratoria]|uniref:uncharacterized protein LOC143039244 n=1 Tax=Oratosquilla oratoria TaxID=337810 RepID=UPI003F763249
MVVANRRKRQTKPRPETGPSRFPVIVKPVDNPTRFAILGSWRQAQLIKNAVGPVEAIRQTPSGEWLVSCTKEVQQGKLLRTPNLTADRDKPLRILTRMPKTVVIGVIKGVPLEEHAEQLLKSDLEAQDLRVDSIKRLTTRDGTPTVSVRVAFLMASLPSAVKLGYTLHQVVPYIAPVKRCTKCQLLGHSKGECRRKTPRCARCGKNHPIQDCQEQRLFCINCCGNHSAAYSDCPEFAIRRVVHELKNENFIPFSEALSIARERWNSYLKGEKSRDRDFDTLPRIRKTPGKKTSRPDEVPTNETALNSPPTHDPTKDLYQRLPLPPTHNQP